MQISAARFAVSVGLLGVVFVGACSADDSGNASSGTGDRATAGSPGTVGEAGVELVSVTDGDTIDIRLDGRDDTVRLIGMNAPERGECLYDQATDELRRLLEVGELHIEADTSDRDQYDRLLRYVYADDVFVNETMVEAGLAIARRYPPDVARDAELAAAQQRAQAAGAGMWALDACGTRASDTLAIAEINYDAPGDDSLNLNGEWVDVRNDGSSSADLTGWVLRDESASHRYEFPAGTTLAPAAAVRIFTGCGSDSPTQLYWCVSGSAIWNNDGDTALLLDPNGNVIAQQSYAG